jgi:hypothetical protein
MRTKKIREVCAICGEHWIAASSSGSFMIALDDKIR